MSDNINYPFSFRSGATFRNPLIMAPMTTSSSQENGMISREELNYYYKRSHEVGAVITACAYISPEGQAFQNGLGASNDGQIASLRQLASVIQAGGAKAILQIYHGGRMSRPEYNGDVLPVAPSPIPPIREWAVTPKELTHTEIEQLIIQFKEAVRRALLAGFDGVELHGANTYLLQQFYSPHSNTRSDRWGGNRKERMQFIIEIIRGCQEVIANEAERPFVLGYRFSPEEIEEPGIRLEDTFYLIDELCNMELDYLHISLGHYTKSSLLDSESNEPILNQISRYINGRIPLIGVGGIKTLEDVECVLKTADLASVGKALIIDPLWAKKILGRQGNAIQQAIRVSDKETLVIPPILWNQIVSIPQWFPVDFEDNLLIEEHTSKNKRVFLLWHQLIQWYKENNKATATLLKDFNISQAQFEILARLVETDKVLSQQEIAKKLLVTQGNITHLLSKLEQSGLILKKKKWKTNGIHLTDKGHNVYTKVAPQLNDLHIKYFSKLTREEQKELYALLSKLNE